MSSSLKIMKNHYEATSYLLLWSPFFIAIGIFYFFSLPEEPSLNIFFDPIFAGFAISLIFSMTLKKFRPFLPIFISFFLGFVASDIRVRLIDTYMTGKSESCIIQGNVISVRQVRDVFPNQTRVDEIGQDITLKNAHRAMLKNVKIIKRFESNKKIEQNLEQIHNLTIISKSGLFTGDRIIAKVQLNPIKDSPISPNARLNSYLKGISANAIAVLDEKIEIIGTLDDFLTQTRINLHKKFLKILGPRSGGFASALITGIRDDAMDIQIAFSNSGLAHLLAISGLHMSVIASIIFFICRKLFLPFFPIMSYKIAAFFSIIATLIYLLISGCPVSALRSFIMSFLFLISIILYRRVISIRSVMFVAAIILLTTPEAVINPSFILSFSAVISLIAFYDALRKNRWLRASDKKSWAEKIAVYFLILCSSSFISTLATVAYCIFFFRQFSVYGESANLVAIPLITLMIMPLSLLTIFLMLFQSVPFTSKPLEILIEFLIRIAEHFSSLPQIDFSNYDMSVIEIICITFGGLAICLTQNKLRWLGVIPISLIIALHKNGPDAQAIISKDKIIIYGERKRIKNEKNDKQKYSLKSSKRKSNNADHREKSSLKMPYTSAEISIHNSAHNAEDILVEILNNGSAIKKIKIIDLEKANFLINASKNNCEIQILQKKNRRWSR